MGLVEGGGSGQGASAQQNQSPPRGDQGSGGIQQQRADTTQDLAKEALNSNKRSSSRRELHRYTQSNELPGGAGLMGSQSHQDLPVPDSASQDLAAPVRLPLIPSQSPDLASFADTTYMTQPGLALPLGLDAQAYPSQF